MRDGLPIEIQPTCDYGCKDPYCKVFKQRLIFLEKKGLIVTTESSKHLIRIKPKGISLAAHPYGITRFCLSDNTCSMNIRYE